MLRSRAPDSTTVLVGLAATAAAACAWQPLDAIVALRAPADASADAAPAADAEQGAAACAPSVTPIQEWTFDASSESWSSALDTGVAASLAWSGAVGQPAAGSIEFDVTPRASDGGSTSGAWVEYDMPIANLAGRTIAAWVMLEAGTSPELKVFAQTGPQYIWADNGINVLSPHTWTCVSLPLASPSYDQANFDPTNVIRIGFEMLAAAPFKIAFDTVVVY